MTDFERLFSPRAVGIIGANNHDYGGGYFLKCLTAIEFDKPIYLFNPRLEGQELYGYKVYKSILDIPDDKPIDYVIIAVPAKICPQILEQVGQKKIPFATIFSSGFSELDRPELEQEILNVARKHNIRFLGPNCLGLYVPKSRLAINRFQQAKSGPLGLICQSGGLAIYLSHMGAYSYGTYSSKVISLGNQADLNIVDFLEYFLIDNDTKVIGLYIENLKGLNIGQRFLKVVKELSLKGKPVIIWKVGYGESAKEAILSHTGGLAGSEAIWKAIPKQTGASLVGDSYDLISLAMGFNYLKFPENRNIGIIALGGGASIELTDIMEKHNLNIPKLAEETKEKFQEFLPEVNTIIRNPLDLGGAGTIMDIYYKSITTLAQDPNISTIVFNRVYNYNPEFTKTIVKAKKNIKDKQIVCVSLKIMNNVSDYKEKLRFKTALFMNKIPVFESVERAAKALDQMNTYREFLEKQGKI